MLVGKGLPDQAEQWAITCAAALTAFNFVPVSTTDRDSLFALWVEVKKSELRKQKSARRNG